MKNGWTLLKLDDVRIFNDRPFSQTILDRTHRFLDELWGRLGSSKMKHINEGFDFHLAAKLFCQYTFPHYGTVTFL
jgi:hypothetical protein